jgi:5-methylcytosine-specific restriction endonuclease McrA
MSRNQRPVLFRPPWAPAPGSHRQIWRDQQRRRELPPEARGYTNDWRKLSRLILEQEPLCRYCGERRAQLVDHIVSIREAPERRLDPSNLAPACHPCHRAKTNRHDGGFGRPRRPLV